MRIAAVTLSVAIAIMPAVVSAQPTAQSQPAPAIAGRWQGILHTNKDLRIAIQISSENGRLHAVMYPLDQKLKGIPAAWVTFQNSVVMVYMPTLSGSYQGMISQDGNTIEGEWRENFAGAVSLNLERANSGTEWVLPQGDDNSHVDKTPKKMQFEVSTIKPSDPKNCCSRRFLRNGRRFTATNTSLKFLMQYAFDLHASQVEGGPAWFDRDLIDLTGEVDGDDSPTDRQWKIALQELLVDRLGLQFHHETKEQSAYALVIAKGGPKLIPSDGGLLVHQRMGFTGDIGQTMYGHGTNATMSDFVGELQRVVMPRPVVDRTGLTGSYNILLTFTRENPESIGMGPPLPDNAPPDFFVALEQQLGLTLQPTKAPVEILVIDHVDHPSAN